MRSKLTTLIPFIHLPSQFITRTEIDVFAYCTIGFMVLLPLPVRANESVSLSPGVTPATAGFKTNVLPTQHVTVNFCFI